MHAIAEIFRSPEWAAFQTVLNWLLCYVFYRLGKKRAQLEALDILEIQHKLIVAQHQQLQVVKTHLDNREAQLAEAKEQHAS